jgi:hypothetical protein
MKSLIALVVFLLMMPQFVLAQDAQRQTKGEAYVFIAPIVSNTQYIFNPAYAGVIFPIDTPAPSNLFLQKRGGVNTGFGGEVFVYKGLGVGAEAGYLAPDWSFSGNNGVGVVSLDGSYHFLGEKNRRKIEPFLVGGYSLYYGDRTSTESGFNFGGGINWWFCRHAGLRLELREQDHIHYFHSQFTRIVAFRVGLSFR